MGSMLFIIGLFTLGDKLAEPHGSDVEDFEIITYLDTAKDGAFNIIDSVMVEDTFPIDMQEELFMMNCGHDTPLFRHYAQDEIDNEVNFLFFLFFFIYFFKT